MAGVTPPFNCRSILVPIDFSAASRHALKYAVPLARQAGAKLILLYIVEPIATPDFAYFPLVMENDKIVAAGYAQLKKVCAQEKIDPASIEKLLVRDGVAHHEITQAARTLKADLIVIATRGNTGLKQVVMGSTAERVVRHAGCPVLVVR
jgi:nucleotide-binding universal stress UspA family protein